MEYVVSEVFFLKVKFKEEIRVQGQTLTQHKATESVSADERWGSHTSSPKKKKKKSTAIKVCTVSTVLWEGETSRSRDTMMMAAITVHQSRSPLSQRWFFYFRFFAGRGWRRKGVLLTCREGGRRYCLSSSAQTC